MFQMCRILTPQNAWHWLVSATFLVFFSGYGASAQSLDVIRIGAVHALSAPLRTEKPLTAVLEMLVERQNQNGGVLGKRLELIIEDSGGDPAQAALKAGRLFERDRIDVIFGGWTVAEKSVLGTVATDKRKLLFYPGPYPCMPTQPTVFCLGGGLEFKAQRAIDYFMSKNGVMAWVLVVSSDTDNVRLLHAVEEYLVTKNVKPSDINSVPLPRGTIDWRDVVSKNIASKISGPASAKFAVLFAYPGPQISDFYSQLRSQGINLDQVPIVTLYENQLGPAGGADTGTDTFAVRRYFQSNEQRPNPEFKRQWTQFLSTRAERNLPIGDGVESYVVGFNLWIEAVRRAQSFEFDRVAREIIGIKVSDLSGRMIEMKPNHEVSPAALIGKAKPDGSFEIVGSMTDVVIPPTPGGGGYVQSPPPIEPARRPNPVAESRSLSLDNLTVAVETGTPQWVFGNLQELISGSKTALDSPQFSRLIEGLCTGGSTACSNGKPVAPLKADAVVELHRRTQIATLGKVIAPEDIEAFTGRKMDGNELEKISTGSWGNDASPPAKQAIDALNKYLSPALTDSLLKFASLGRIQQTLPGDGTGSGSPRLNGPSPGDGPPSDSSVPILPSPITQDTPNGKICVADGQSAASGPQFGGQGRGTAPGQKPPAYCRDGFLDILLLDTGTGAVCSGVRIGAAWALTARHCVENWSKGTGRVFQPTPQSVQCLETVDASKGHPGDLCKMDVVPRGEAITPSADAKLDIALVPVSNGGPRHASVKKFDARPMNSLEITLAGYGASPGAPAGRLRVGWTEIRRKETLLAMADSATPGAGPSPPIPIIYINPDYSTDRLVSWSCGGDSGAPLFAGRVFGWAGETHNVAAINVEGTIGTKESCSPLGPREGDITSFVFLQNDAVRQWLCTATKDELDVCH
jgi:urea transport system substrate-binding protein